MKNYFLLILAGIFLYACGRGTGSTNSDIPGMDRVKIKEQQKNSVDSIIAKIDYIKLGDTGDVLIGKVTHLLFTPDHIVVGDADKAQAIFIFDRQGNPQTVINRFGRGPQEYQSIQHIFLTPDKKTVGIVDRGGRKILYFDMDGNLKDKKALPFYCDNAEWLDDETMMLVSSDGTALESYPNKEDLLFFTDSTLQIKSSAFPNPFDQTIFHYWPLHVKRFGDRIHACKAFGDTIYQVTSDGISPRYWLDMTAIDGTANFGKDMSSEKIKEPAYSTNFPNIYVESDDYAIFFMSNKGFVLPVLFNKQTKKTYNIEFVSRTALGMNLLSSQFALDNQFVAAVPAFQFLAFCPDVPGVELRNEIKEGLTDEDNPVLLFYTLKDPDVE